MMIIRARILEFGLCGWMMAGDYEYLSQQWLPQDKFNVDSRFLQSDWRRTSFGDSHTSKQSAMMNQWHGTDLWPPWRCRSPLRTRMTWWCFNSLLDGAFNSLLGRCFCKACLGGACFHGAFLVVLVLSFGGAFFGGSNFWRRGMDWDVFLIVVLNPIMTCTALTFVCVLLPFPDWWWWWCWVQRVHRSLWPLQQRPTTIPA